MFMDIEIGGNLTPQNGETGQAMFLSFFGHRQLRSHWAVDITLNLSILSPREVVLTTGSDIVRGQF
jgi:hypothetical protein